ncbi:MAG TPA: APC family permease [Ktedonobacteraceae bacterium]|nr:APC family permease [Ktedonobacteraceae bacterium]
MSDIVEDVTTLQGAVQDTALKKNALGLPGVLFQSIASMAPAAAVATSLTPAIPLAGAALPLSVLLATIACALIAYCIGQLAIHIPSAGGLYTYISRSLGVNLGFMSAWTFLLAQPLLLPLVALVWGPYAEDLVKTLIGIDISWMVWVGIGFVGLFLLTYYGIKLSADASILLGSLEMLIILSLSIVMIVKSSGGNNLATFTPVFSPTGWSGIFQGMIFVFLAFVGFEACAPLGEETANPKRNVPRAIVYSAIGIGLFYVLAAYAGVIGWGIPHISGYAGSAAPWNDLAHKFWGAIGPIIITFAILNSSLGNGNAGINASSRVAYAMGRIGTLPSPFAHLSPHRTPAMAIAVQIGLSLVIAIACGLVFGVQNAFGLLGAVLTLGLLLLYFASCVSAFVFYLRERRQDFHIVQHVIVPIIPLVILCFVFVAQVYPIPAYPLNLTVPIVVVWLLLGIVYLVYLQRKKPIALQRGKDMFLVDLEPEPANLERVLL